MSKANLQMIKTAAKMIRSGAEAKMTQTKAKSSREGTKIS